MLANARRMAVEALLKVNNENAYSNITLNNLLKNSDASDNDKALATALFYGVLDRRITLDYVLDSLTKTPFKKVNFFTAEVMRVGLYQIMYMDRIPNSAAVDEAVKMIKKSKEHRNSGFVNAVLRAAIRAEKLLPDGDSVKELSVIYSCPEWIVDEFIKDYGKEQTILLLNEFLKPSSTHLRVNTTKITPDEFLKLLDEKGIDAVLDEPYGAVTLKSGANIEKMSLYKKGYFFVQDISSQRAVSVLAPKPNERVLDMCAAPGGKTFSMACLMQNKGEIVSCDIHEHRVELIKNSALRLGLNIVKPTLCDATQHSDNIGKFDAILCDVPCSGFGIIGRKPDIKYKKADDFAELENLQYSILNNAANYLANNGRILYSTCTLRKNENEVVVNKFLDTHKDCELKYIHTFLPNIDGTDGFFTALLQKR
ncbi:MAG: 16S rRNA (cytosine(967)-C(5))-methyltransferase RsmB [Clostridia bacterium]|nr:16S rRNA (cytosine(967)-C(5))-methyltransferase RsmB [Clostridia bacterium]